MARPKRIEGVLAPVITPFRKDYAPDAERFVRHCRWLLKNGCSGLAVFGTNSEANSMSVPEKRRLLEALIAGGVAPAMLMPGTGHCALTDSVELSRARSEEHTSELQSRLHLVCRLLLEKKKTRTHTD